MSEAQPAKRNTHHAERDDSYTASARGSYFSTLSHTTITDSPAARVRNTVR